MSALVSVIVPAHSVEYGLEATLEALSKQEFEDSFEILVGNDGADPEVTSLCRRKGVAVVDSVPGGSSYRARNRAVEQATGEILAFVDSNKIPTPRWLAECVTGLEEHSADYGGGPVVVIREKCRAPDSAYWLQAMGAFPCRHYLTDLHFAVTGNLVVRRAAFDAVGGFLDDVISSGDLDFGQRVHRAGYRQVYLAEATVETFARSSAELAQKRLRVRYGKLALALSSGQSLRVLLPWRGLFVGFLKASGVRSTWFRLRNLPYQHRIGATWLEWRLHVLETWFLLRIRRQNRLSKPEFYRRGTR